MDDSDFAVWPNSVRRLERIISVTGTTGHGNNSLETVGPVHNHSSATDFCISNIVTVMHFENSLLTPLVKRVDSSR